MFDWLKRRKENKKYIPPVLMEQQAEINRLKSTFDDKGEGIKVETMQLGVGENVPLPIGAFRYRIGSSTKVKIDDEFLGTGNYGMVKVVGLDHNTAFCYVMKVKGDG